MIRTAGRVDPTVRVRSTEVGWLAPGSDVAKGGNPSDPLQPVNLPVGMPRSGLSTFQMKQRLRKHAKHEA